MELVYSTRYFPAWLTDERKIKCFFFSSRRRHTRLQGDWSSDVCSSDLYVDPNGYFFSADTIEELATRIVNEYQWRPMPPNALKRAVDRYNSFVDTGTDLDFKKPTPMHKIAKPPFYAAWHTRSEEHTSELQSPCNLVCRLLL